VQSRQEVVGEFLSTCNNTAANATEGATVDFFINSDWANSASRGHLIQLGVGDLVGEGS